MNLEQSQAKKIIFDPYHNVIERLPQIQKNNLLDNLAKLTHIGVESFGYRVIDHNGHSAVFSTCNRRLSLPYDDHFYSAMADHMNAEVISMFNSQRQFITRSEDKINSEYLSLLTQHGMNNSIVIYKFHHTKIEMFFLFASSADSRDIMLNNLSYITTVIHTMTLPLNSIANSPEFIENKKQLLSAQVVRHIFRKKPLAVNGQRSKIEIRYDGKTIFLSMRELHCFGMIGVGLSNKSIAMKMGISDLTVKDYITKLKQIFSVGSRDILSDLARSQELRYITQIINKAS